MPIYGMALPDIQADHGMMTGMAITGQPERLADREFGPTSELFSLGATLFAAVEAYRPSTGARRSPRSLPLSKTGRHRCCAPGRCARSWKDSSLLAKDPERRLSADHARAGLHDIQCEHGIGTSPDS